jgi:hypothetical protein
MLSLPTKIMAGAIVALVLALGVVGYLYRGEVREGAALRFANDANLATIARLESDIIINEAKAIADALERRELEGDARDLQRAIDAVTENGCADPAFDALLERRRLQLDRDRNKGR